MASTRTQWKKLAEKEKVTNLSIHNEQVPSGSKFELRHYLLLRVLWKRLNPRTRKKGSRFHPEEFGLDTWIEYAKDKLKDYHWWNVYCESLERGEPAEGNFFVPGLFQKEAAAVDDDDTGNDIVFFIPENTRAKKERRRLNKAKKSAMTSTPNNSPVQLPPYENHGEQDDMEEYVSESSSFKPSSSFSESSSGSQEIWNQMYPRSEGEGTVNAALVSFLKAITAHFNLSSDWTMHQKPLKAKFANTQYEARSDGYLKGIYENDVRGLIEAKPFFRGRDLLDIRIQESAQNVAWLMEDSKASKELPGRRFHVSQDRHEIWVIFALHGQKYLRFLSGEVISPDDPESFSTMYEVGPFDTTKAEHMRNLGPLVLALALRADHDREREQEDAETGQEDIEMEEDDTEDDTESSQDPLAECLEG